MAGKLNGVMPAQTPTGWRIDQLSMPAPTLSVKSPRSRCGMPHANSTTSSPRMTSPRASDSTLPCSSVISRASSSRCVSMSDLKRNSTRARCRGGVAAHAGSARRAEAIAADVSAALARASCARTWPVAGSYTLPYRADPSAATRPSMKCPSDKAGRHVRAWGRGLYGASNRSIHALAPGSCLSSGLRRPSGRGAYDTSFPSRWVARSAARPLLCYIPARGSAG